MNGKIPIHYSKKGLVEAVKVAAYVKKYMKPLTAEALDAVAAGAGENKPNPGYGYYLEPYE